MARITLFNLKPNQAETDDWLFISTIKLKRGTFQICVLGTAKKGEGILINLFLTKNLLKRKGCSFFQKQCDVNGTARLNMLSGINLSVAWVRVCTQVKKIYSIIIQLLLFGDFDRFIPCQMKNIVTVVIGCANPVWWNKHLRLEYKG